MIGPERWHEGAHIPTKAGGRVPWLGRVITAGPPNIIQFMKQRPTMEERMAARRSRSSSLVRGCTRYLGRYKGGVQYASDIVQEAVFTANGQLTEHGQKVALNALLAIPFTERKCKYLLWDFEDLQKRAKKNPDEDFKWAESYWWDYLCNFMKEHKVSKEQMLSYGFDYKAARKFHFLVIAL